MLPTRHEFIARFHSQELVDHSVLGGFQTFAFLKDRSSGPITLELPHLKLVVHGLDYLTRNQPIATNQTLRFQQDHYRLWFQVDGQGILQNVTRGTFGTARPGLLGIMGVGERHTYLHQKGSFECFTLDFSLLPSAQAKCYWNTEIEGKIVLDERERLYFENLVFDLFAVIDSGRETLGLASTSRILEMIVVLFRKGLLVVEESQFPKNKPKSLVALARNFMNQHYAGLSHQRALEEECGRDINYLNVLFKKETGKTLYQYLTGVRMEHAKFMLEEGATPVSDIAGKVGYPNANSFTRSFRKVHGVAPSDYREKRARPPVAT